MQFTNPKTSSSVKKINETKKTNPLNEGITKSLLEKYKYNSNHYPIEGMNKNQMQNKVA